MPQFRQTPGGSGPTEIDHGSRGTRSRHLRGHALVRFLAERELGRRGRGRAPRPLGTLGPTGPLEPPEALAARETFRRAYRELGVVLSPAVGGLERLDVYVYRPLRDAAFLTARGFDDEVAERAAAGLPVRRAFQETALDWTEGVAMLLDDGAAAAGEPPDELFLNADRRTGAALARRRSFPYQLELIWRRREQAANGRARLGADAGPALAHQERMAARRATFSRCDADFAAAGHAEVLRVIFVTTLMIADDVRDRDSRLARGAFEGLYQAVIRRFRTVTASLVVDG